MNYWAIGIRNIAKNRRRSLITVLAIAAGSAAISLFAGYIKNVYSGLAEQAVRGERLGHLTIRKPGLMEQGRLDVAKYLFSAAELAQVSAIVRADPQVQIISPRLSVSGIISNGKVSTIFIGEGVDPAHLEAIRSGFRADRGGQLDPRNAIGGAVSSDLAKILGLQRGQWATVLTTTVEGQANALDLDVVDIFNSGNASTNDKYLLLPFTYTQELYDTSGAERIVVVLDDRAHSDEARTRLAAAFRAAGLQVEIKSWLELSSFYVQVKNLLDMIFLFIFSIVFTIVVMSVINTMSMSIIERTREIGTLRALGMRRAGVMRLFTVEGTLLAVLGCAVGLVVTLLVALAVNLSGISYVPPNFSDPVELLVDVDVFLIAAVFGFMVLLSAASALLPARVAARIQIVDALGHV